MAAKCPSQNSQCLKMEKEKQLIYNIVLDIQKERTIMPEVLLIVCVWVCVCIQLPFLMLMFRVLQASMTSYKITETIQTCRHSLAKRIPNKIILNTAPI